MNYYDYRTYFNQILDLLEEYLPLYETSLESILSSVSSILSTLDTFLPFLLIVIIVKLVSSWW